jgi:hypothetical protein
LNGAPPADADRPGVTIVFALPQVVLGAPG